DLLHRRGDQPIRLGRRQPLVDDEQRARRAQPVAHLCQRAPRPRAELDPRRKTPGLKLHAALARTPLDPDGTPPSGRSRPEAIRIDACRVRGWRARKCRRAGAPRPALIAAIVQLTGMVAVVAIPSWRRTNGY